MAHVSCSRDDKPPTDQALEAAGDGASALGKPIRCRIQPMLYDWGKTGYGSWQGLAWTVDCADVAEGRRLRRGLAAFFKAFGGDAARQGQVLKVLEKLAGGR